MFRYQCAFRIWSWFLFVSWPVTNNRCCPGPIFNHVSFVFPVLLGSGNWLAFDGSLTVVTGVLTLFIYLEHIVSRKSQGNIHKTFPSTSKRQCRLSFETILPKIILGFKDHGLDPKEMVIRKGLWLINKKECFQSSYGERATKKSYRTHICC